MNLFSKQTNYKQFIDKTVEQILSEDFRNVKAFVDDTINQLNTNDLKVHQMPARTIKQAGIVGYYEYDTGKIYAGSETALKGQAKKLGISPEMLRLSTITHEKTHAEDYGTGLDPYKLSSVMKSERNAASTEGLLLRRQNKETAKHVTQDNTWSQEYDLINTQIKCPTCKRSPIALVDKTPVGDKEFSMRAPTSSSDFSNKKIKMPDLHLEEPNDVSCPHCATGYRVTNVSGNWKVNGK